MPAQFAEAIAIVPDDWRSEARNWFERAGFQVTSMRAGMLISGSGQLFQTVFGTDMERGDRDIALPIPEDLRNKVGSIVIRRPPSIHD
jgi:hypothetical protein